MNSIQDIINKAVEGLEITEKEKQALMGSYLVEFYSICLKLLIGFNAGNTEFVKKLNENFDSYTNTLLPEQKKIFSEAIVAQKPEILAKILSELRNNLPKELQQKVENNISAITS